MRPQKKKVLYQEFPALINELVICENLPIFGHIRNHIPMDGRNIFATTLGVRLTDGHVDGATDFLIKKDIARHLLDIGVGADSGLAEPTSAIKGENIIEKILAQVGRPGFDKAIFDLQTHVLNLPPHVIPRKSEGNEALDAVFNRARENLARRHVVQPIRIYPSSTLAIETDICVRRKESKATRKV